MLMDGSEQVRTPFVTATADSGTSERLLPVTHGVTMLEPIVVACDDPHVGSHGRIGHRRDAV
jgi:hypothetical protein